MTAGRHSNSLFELDIISPSFPFFHFKVIEAHPKVSKDIVADILEPVDHFFFSFFINLVNFRLQGAYLAFDKLFFIGRGICIQFFVLFEGLL